MRVAIVGAFPEKPDLPRGGPQAGAVTLVRALLNVQPDLDLHVLRCPASEEHPPRRQGEPPYTVHDVYFGGPMKDMLTGRRARHRVQRLLDELAPDVVHVRGHARLVDGRRYPSVLSIHGFPERDTMYRNPRSGWLRGLVLTRLYRKARARYPHILANAAYVAREIQPYCRGRIHLVPNAVDERFFAIERQESGPRILTAAVLGPLKNIHGLMEAVDILAKRGVACQLRLAGPIVAEGYRERLEDLSRQFGIEQQVTFLGKLDRPALIEEMRAARCLALPSFLEGSPNIVSEAAAVGVPAVVSWAGGAPELVFHGYSGYVVDPYSSESIADGLQPFLEDANLAGTFGRRARGQVEPQRADAVAEKTICVYRLVAG